MKLSYNAPVTITFTLVASAIFIISLFTGGAVTNAIFSTPGNQQGFSFFSLDLLRLISHPLAHKDWAHLIGNFSFILLLGPILEEKYGSTKLLLMMIFTAFITGLINVLFLSTGLIGASGIVFMFILLVSFTNMREGEIPLTFIFVTLLYLTKQILDLFQPNNSISELAHIIGGVCGAGFGFILSPKKTKTITGPEQPV
jgi:membrane associated rhomboid family serine protease